MRTSQNTNIKTDIEKNTACSVQKPENVSEREKVIAYLERGVFPETIAKVTSLSIDEINSIYHSLL